MSLPSVGFHGVRGSCPCSDPELTRYGGATACVTVDPGDDSPPILFDLGTGCRRAGHSIVERFFPGAPASAGAGPRDDAAGARHHDAAAARHHDGAGTAVRLAAFVTHLHFDHVQGLPFFAPALQDAVRLDVYGPNQDGSLAEAFEAFLQPPYFPVGVGELPAELNFHSLPDGGVVQVGSATVRAREVPHVGRTLGYRLEIGGAALAYIGDHQAPSRDGHVVPEVSAAVLELCSGVDLLVHDAQYTNAEFAVKSHWGHSTVDYAVEVARQSGARRLALFHHDPTHGDDLLDRLGAEAAASAAGAFEVFMAAEGTEMLLAPHAPATAHGPLAARL